MEKEKNNTLPPCMSCSHAWRAAEGYIRACTVNLKNTPLQMYRRCVEAFTCGSCQQWEPREV